MADEQPKEKQDAHPVSTPATVVPPVVAEAAPDPEEDDLDDLDDVLDEFAATKLDTPSAPASSGPGRPLPATVATASSEPPPLPSLPPGLDASSEDDEFAKQLQAGMASLLGELESSPEMQKQFEEMMRELGQQAAAETEGTAGGEIPGLPPFSVPKDAAAPASASVTASEAAKAESSFQETIKRTMERMQESGEAAGAAAASSQPESDIMAALLREMENGGGEGGDDDFSKMLMGIMEQLTNKEILYEPMKELHDKFPAWMEKNKGKVSADDMKRYEEQKSLATEIVAKFEEPGYSDENVDSRQYIVDRMQKMQAAGAPPPDLVGDMNAAQEALGEIDSGCPQQ